MDLPALCKFPIPSEEFPVVRMVLTGAIQLPDSSVPVALSNVGSG